MEGVSFVAHPFCVPLKLSRKHTKAFNEPNESFGDMQRKLSTNQTRALRLDEYRSTVAQITDKPQVFTIPRAQI